MVGINLPWDPPMPSYLIGSGFSPSKTNHDWNFRRKVTTFGAERVS